MALKLAVVAAFLIIASPAWSRPLADAESRQVDALVGAALAESGVPSASVALVQNGELAFAKAYGFRSIEPAVPATIHDRYDVGSIQKQFTAAAALALSDDGKLALDDKVAVYFPDLRASDHLTLRQLLSHTSGYRGFFTLEVAPLEARREISPTAIADRWGKAPLDFEPGSRWAYSNTGFTIAGLIVEQAGRAPLMDVIQARIFDPLNMTSAGHLDARPLTATDARGYTRYGLGPPRPAKSVAPGWTFAAGRLGLTAVDLARWDQAMIERRILSAPAWSAFEADTRLTDGAAAGYGLGVYVGEKNGVRRIRHDGSSDGFLAENRVYPDIGLAIVVLVNADYGHAQTQIARGIEGLLLPKPSLRPAAPTGATRQQEAPQANPDELRLAKDIYRQLRTGDLDRSRLSPDLNAYFDEAVLADYRRGLAALGEPRSFVQLRSEPIGGLNASLYEISWGAQKLIAVLRVAPAGQVASFVVFAP